MGTWIEIYIISCYFQCIKVVPYVGTWIEIVKVFPDIVVVYVVPYVGTWIEIANAASESGPHMSFPMWERGLK